MCHLERTEGVIVQPRPPVSCQTVRDAAPPKGMLSGPFLSIISPGTLIKAVEVHPGVPPAATEKSNLSDWESPCLQTSHTLVFHFDMINASTGNEATGAVKASILFFSNLEANTPALSPF